MLMTGSAQVTANASAFDLHGHPPQDTKTLPAEHPEAFNKILPVKHLAKQMPYVFQDCAICWPTSVCVWHQ